MAKEHKNKKPINKKKISLGVLFIVILLLLFGGGYYYYSEIYLPTNTDYSLAVYADNEATVGEVKYSKFDYIEVQDGNQELAETINLTEDTNEIQLTTPQNTDDLVFKNWELQERNEDREIELLNLFGINQNVKVIEAIPIYENSKDHLLTFRTDKNAKLISNEQEVSYVKIPYQADQNINDLFPNVEVKEGYKGDWVINENIVNNETEITEDSELVFQTYQDFNDNNTDDLAEAFTIEFETNADQEINPIDNISWEETVDLPVVEDENLLFYDWYTDPQLENIFTEETKVQNNLTLYADMQSLNDIVNNSVDRPIKREDIALRVSELLDNRNETVDLTFGEQQKQEEQQREELRKYNEENNITMQPAETSIRLHNTEHNKLHLINFLDPSNNFLFAVVAPYGQTIKITNERGELIKEYGVRQQTHLVLNENDIISNGKELDEYHTEYKQVNDTVFIKVQPTTK